MKRAFFLAAVGIAPVAAAQQIESNRLQPIETVIVIGKKNTEISTDLAGSLDVISQEEIGYEHVDDTLELFRKVPGVYLSRFNQGIINTDVAIRGFAAEGSTPHAKLLIDGIPSNLHNGYGELDQLFPLAIESIEVFKGTSDPRYGLFNIAGNYSVASRADAGGSQLEATLGSFNAREIQAYTGLQSGNLVHNYFAGYRSSKGYREHTDLDKFSVSGRWQWQLAEDASIAAIARASGYEGDSPGYLSREEAADNPESSAPYANQDGGEKNIHHLSLHLDKSFGKALAWSLKGYWQSFERERWVRFSEASTLQNRYDDQGHSGLISRLNWQIDPAWRLEWGLDLENQDVVEQRFGTLGQSRQRDSAAIGRNFEYEFDTRGTYLQVEHSPNAFITWNAALRLDKLSGDFVARSAEGQASPGRLYDFGSIAQPKINILISPVDQLTLFANAGRSFQHPFGADAYTAQDIRSRDVSVNDGWEVGGRWAVREPIELRLSYWQQRASDELVVIDELPQNVGETERSGAELVANWIVSDRLYFWGSYSRVKSRIVRSSDTQQQYQGNVLRAVPDYTASFGLNYAVATALTARLHLDAQGDYYVNEANLGGRFGGYELLNASVDYALSWGQINLQVNNLLEDEYEYVYDFSSDGTGSVHSPGDGINASLSVRYELQP